MIKKLLLLAMLLIFALSVSANNLRLSGKPLISSESDGVVNIELSLLWDNAWRGGYNWDAVWLFFKYKTSDDNAWQHVNLDTDGSSFSEPSSGGKDYSHSFGKTGGKAVGVFVYLAEDAFCDPTVKCKLQWTLPAGVTKADFDNNEAFLLTQAIEMVYIPYGTFQLGQAGKPLAFNSADIYSEEANSLVVNAGSTAALSVDYPKGYRGFHAMKYETSQEQFVTFLNTLTLEEQTKLVPKLEELKVGDYAFGTSAQSARPDHRNGIILAHKVAGNPVHFATNLTTAEPYSHSNDGDFVACNYISVDAMQAYCSWSGLRPMSELEFEKSCRLHDVPQPPADEYIWGSTAAPSLASGLINAGQGSERPSSGQVNAGGRLGGPLRGGSIASTAGAAGNANQQTTGSTYWGLMEMGGNLREICASASNGAISYDKHGDGTVGGKWGTNASDFGYRGGSFASTNPASLQTSDRSDMSASVTSMNAPCKESGFRGARSFEADTYRDSLVPGAIGIDAPYICPDGGITINNITDASINGMGNIHFVYFWYVDNEPQPEQTASSFELTDLVAGHTYAIKRTATCILGTTEAAITTVIVPNAVAFVLDDPIVWSADNPTVTASSTPTPPQNLAYVWTYGDKILDSEAGVPPLPGTSTYKPINSDFVGGVGFIFDVSCTGTYAGCSSGSSSETLIVHTHVLDAGQIAVATSVLCPGGEVHIENTELATIDDQANNPLTYSWYLDGSFHSSSNTPNLSFSSVNAGRTYRVTRRVSFDLGYRETSVSFTVPPAVLFSLLPSSASFGQKVITSSSQNLRYEWKHGNNVVGSGASYTPSASHIGNAATATIVCTGFHVGCYSGSSERYLTISTLHAGSARITAQNNVKGGYVTVGNNVSASISGVQESISYSWYDGSGKSLGSGASITVSNLVPGRTYSVRRLARCGLGDAYSGWVSWTVPKILHAGSINVSASEITTAQTISFGNTGSGSVEGGGTPTYSWVISGTVYNHNATTFSKSGLGVGSYSAYRRATFSGLGTKNSNTVYFTVTSAFKCGEIIQGIPTILKGGRCWTNGDIAGKYYTWEEALTTCQNTLGAGWSLPYSGDFKNLNETAFLHGTWGKGTMGYLLDGVKQLGYPWESGTDRWEHEGRYWKREEPAHSHVIIRVGRRCRNSPYLKWVTINGKRCCGHWNHGNDRLECNAYSPGSVAVIENHTVDSRYKMPVRCIK